MKLLIIFLVTGLLLLGCEPHDSLAPSSNADSGNNCDTNSSANFHSDPDFSKQWHLQNTGQNGGKCGMDINVLPVWQKAHWGEGMTIVVLDDFVDRAHPDLRDNLPPKNLVTFSPVENGNHGTAVAGIIAASHNGIGIMGIAPKATLSAYDVISGSSVPEARQHVIDILGRKESQSIAAYNGSISSVSGNDNIMLLVENLYAAMTKVTENGFDGRGSSLVFAAGNLGMIGTPSGQAYLNHYAGIGVNSMTNKGQAIAGFRGTSGANLWLLAPGERIWTTDNVDSAGKAQYRYFGATSAATPMVTGVIALLRGAYPQLSWRDVKLILAESATKIDGTICQTTGKMYSSPGKEQKYSETAGFGLVNAGAALELAKNWTPLPAMQETTAKQEQSIDIVSANTDYTSDLTVKNSFIQFIESVSIRMAIEQSEPSVNYNVLSLELISPDNKNSLFFNKVDDYIIFKSNEFVLLSNAFLGSSGVNGTWQLRINEEKRKGKPSHNIKKIKNWQITIRGH